jgi:hypothetical protein
MCVYKYIYLGYGNVTTVRRRGVVFYLDNERSFLLYLRWWLLAWRLLGMLV